MIKYTNDEFNFVFGILKRAHTKERVLTVEKGLEIIEKFKLFKKFFTETQLEKKDPIKIVKHIIIHRMLDTKSVVLEDEMKEKEERREHDKKHDSNYLDL